jgi:hypothetical protein
MKTRLSHFFRPPLAETVTFKVSIMEKQRIVQMAKKHQVSQSQLLRAAILRNLNNRKESNQ